MMYSPGVAEIGTATIPVATSAIGSNSRASRPRVVVACIGSRGRPSSQAASARMCGVAGTSPAVCTLPS